MEISQKSTSTAKVELSFGSTITYIDLVQDVSDNITKILGFDEDARYWIGMSVRESVINAIQHGNDDDESKTVGVTFAAYGDRLVVSVRDQGEGFDLSKLPDPTDPENLLKPSGRGIFYVQSFMDDVSFSQNPTGGMEIRMEKRLSQESQGVKNEDQ